MHPDRIGSVLILMFCALYAWLIQDIVVPSGNQTQFTARSMPTFVCTVATILSLWLLIRPGTASTNNTSVTLADLNWQMGIAFCILMSVYGFSLRPLGFVPSTFAFLLVAFFLLGERRYLRMLTVAGCVSVTFWYLMSEFLGVYLPPLPTGFYA